MMNKSTMVFVLGVSAAAMMSGGCKKEEPEVPPQPTATTPPPATATTPPPAPQTGCDAAMLASFTGIFATRAPAEAPKMSAQGSMVCGNVQEGGMVEGDTFFVEPGKCYTVIANSLPNVTEVDVDLMVDPRAVGLPPAIAALATTPLARDSETGAMGTIGPKNNCFKVPAIALVPVPVRVVVKARNGSGPIGAQVYSK